MKEGEGDVFPSMPLQLDGVNLSQMPLDMGSK